MVDKFGFRKIRCISPKVFIGNPRKNIDEHINLLKETDETFITLFPELSITGYTCEDLFFSNQLQESIKKELPRLIEFSQYINTIIVIGLPYSLHNKLYNCAMVIFKGKIKGIIPKTFLPNYNEFYEQRWFTSGKDIQENITDYNQTFPFGTDILFHAKDTVFGIEICEDAWAAITPSSRHALKGAEIILNLSASNELVAKHEFRKELVSNLSAKLNSIYCYAGAGSLESSKDVVFSGACLIAENGSLLKEQRNFNLTAHSIEMEVDVQKIKNERLKNKTYAQDSIKEVYTNVYINFDSYSLLSLKHRKYPKSPFLPKDDSTYDEILNIQATGLARQLLASKSESMVLGLSGGSDSTWALFVCLEACKRLNWTPDKILTLSMPGFGTSDRTKNQALELATKSKTTFKEISIVKATTQHLKDIEHKDIDVVYENAQARERTQILFDYGNKFKGLVIGTSDCSELALGWGTYNGDTMSGYNVNASIMKTMIKSLIKHYGNYNAELKDVIDQVLATKISPELLPLDKQGNIQQDTESILGSYEYHDFFLFHHFKNNFSNDKILFLGKLAFGEDVSKYFKIFYKRFYQNQFKRTVSPAGVKVGSVSLSPRGDLRMPNEVDIEE